MTAVAERPVRELPSDRTSRAGHVISALLAVVGLWVVNNLLAWDFPPFLTEDFDRVLPLINLSLVVGLAIDVGRILHPRVWLVAVTEPVKTVVGVPALVRMWQVFPFDAEGGALPWELLMRALLVVALVGSIIGVVTGLARLVRLAAAPPPP